MSVLRVVNALNDDCLQEIFERLTIKDLCSVADTCQKFRSNAKQIAPSRFHNYTPAADDLFCLESLLRNFGTNIKSLSIQACSQLQGHSFLLALNKYCSGADCKLQTLRMLNIHIQKYSFGILQPIFARLQQLQVLLVMADELLGKINECQLMRILTIDGRCHRNDNGCSIYRTLSKFPNLRQLELYSEKWTDGNISAAEMMSCLSKVKNLKKLKIHGGTPCLYGDKNILQLLADAEIKIEWLIVNGYNPSD